MRQLQAMWGEHKENSEHIHQYNYITNVHVTLIKTSNGIALSQNSNLTFLQNITLQN